MLRLSQLMIRTALVWLAIGSAVGRAVLLNKGVPLLAWQRAPGLGPLRNAQ